MNATAAKQSFEVLFQLRGDRSFGRVALVTEDEAKAFSFAKDLSNFPSDTIHYAITCEDGRTLHDTRKDGLL